MCRLLKIFLMRRKPGRINAQFDKLSLPQVTFDHGRRDLELRSEFLLHGHPVYQNVAVSKRLRGGLGGKGPCHVRSSGEWCFQAMYLSQEQLTMVGVGNQLAM